MDFWGAARKLAVDNSDAMSLTPDSIDDATLPNQRRDYQPPPATDGQDPATPGGPSPYNGTEPFGRPVTTDPEWLDPRRDTPRPDRAPLPYTGPGPDEDVTTLHNARRASYAGRPGRVR